MISLTIVGCGNMGRAFAEGLIRSGIVSSDSLELVERRAERREALIQELGCRCSDSLTTLGSDYLLLAVKPQDLGECAKVCAPLLKKDTVVISLLAGVSLNVLQKALNGHALVVRSMPNLPAIIGSGMTAFYCAPELPEKRREEVQKIFDAVGESLELKKEDMLNAATAISGSGPAYLYYVLNAWKAAAQDLGFSLAEANILIAQTLTGAAWLWADNDHDEDVLRARVASKGGTTEAAIRVLSEGDVAAIFRRAIRRASERSAELEQLVRETL